MANLYFNTSKLNLLNIATLTRVDTTIDFIMQASDESRWERLRRELCIDEETITQLKTRDSSDNLVSSFLEKIDIHLRTASFSDAYSQLGQLKTSLEIAKAELSEITAEVNELRAKNEQLIAAREEAMYYLQRQISESNYLKETNSANEATMKKAEEDLKRFELENFELHFEVLKAENDKKSLENAEIFTKNQLEAVNCELNATKELLSNYKVEKEVEIQQLRNEIRALTFECQMAKALSTNHLLENQEQRYKLNETNDKIQSADAVFQQQIEALKGEVLSQTQLADQYRLLLSDYESHIKILRDENIKISEQYDNFCFQVELFQREANFKHNHLLREIEVLKVQMNHSRVDYSRSILDISHVI